MTRSQWMKACAPFYPEWCYALLSCIENLEDNLQSELTYVVGNLGGDLDTMFRAVSCTKGRSGEAPKVFDPRLVCDGCGDDYTALGSGLVQPARIAASECALRNHESQGAQQSSQNLNVPIQNDDDWMMDEPFFDAEQHLNQGSIVSDIFTEIATMFYRAPGRLWLGEYAMGQNLCATCFMCKEKYISRDGMYTQFAAMPYSFEGLRSKFKMA